MKVLKVLLLLGILGFAFAVVTTPTRAGDSKSSIVGGGANAAPRDLLVLVSSTCASVGTGRFYECSGAVRNISGETQRNVQVVIAWLDAAGTTQTSDNALIEYNPLLIDQESPWKVIGTTNPALTKYTVNFKQLTGGTIRYRDDRK
jgi:hypothetical protein